MFARNTLLSLAAAAGLIGSTAGRSFAGPAIPGVRPAAVRLADDKADDKAKDENKSEEKVDVAQLPVAVVETVMKECPGGKITEAEKVTKKGKTYYSMDVKVGDTTYDVKTTLDGKFKSKKVDEDEADEKK